MPVPLPARTESPRARRRGELCVRLMAAAEELLDDGVTLADLGVDRLTQQAGVSRSSFYVYFEDRADLMRLWFSSVVDEIVEATRGWWAVGPDPDRAAVRDALGAIVAVYRPHARLMAATFDAATHDADLRRLTDVLISESVDGLRRHIVRGQKAGWVDPALHPESCATHLTWMAERTFNQLLPGAAPRAAERLTETYTDIVWATLYRPVAATS